MLKKHLNTDSYVLMSTCVALGKTLEVSPAFAAAINRTCESVISGLLCSAKSPNT